MTANQSEPNPFMSPSRGPTGPRRRSAWHLALLPICFGSAGLAWYGLFRVSWAVHTTRFPDHQLRDFWKDGIGLRAFVLSFAMMFSLAPAALGFGFSCGNGVIWLIRPLYHKLTREAEQRGDRSFSEIASSLLRWSVILTIVGVAISCSAALFLDSLA